MSEVSQNDYLSLLSIILKCLNLFLKLKITRSKIVVDPHKDRRRLIKTRLFI